MADVIIPSERAELAVHATYEISALIDAIKREMANDDEMAIDYVLPVLFRRLGEINCVAMSILNCDSRTTEEMSKVIHG